MNQIIFKSSLSVHDRVFLSFFSPLSRAHYFFRFRRPRSAVSSGCYRRWFVDFVSIYDALLVGFYWFRGSCYYSFQQEFYCSCKIFFFPVVYACMYSVFIITCSICLFFFKPWVVLQSHFLSDFLKSLYFFNSSCFSSCISIGYECVYSVIFPVLVVFGYQLQIFAFFRIFSNIVVLMQ